MRCIHAVLLLAMVAWAGCGDYELAETRGRSAAPEAVGITPDPSSLAEPARSSERQPPAGKPQPEEPAGQEAAPSPRQKPQETAGAKPGPSGYRSPMPYEEQSTENMIKEKAEVGMGRKGHYRPGIITTPLSTFWRSQEAVAYKIKVPHALNLYKGQHGHFPKTQEAFVREILEPNQIELPELPQGHFYVYDPENGELQVARPK